MNEMFEPRKKERLDKSFFKSFIFIFVAGILLVVGASYSLEFFRVNKSGGTYQFTTSGIVISVTGNNTVNTTLSKYSDSDGITSGLVKEITMTNTQSSDGNVILTLERTSGVELSNLKYALYLNNVIVNVGTVPSDGVLLDQVILGNETLRAKVVLWVDENYTGSLSFNGTISSEVKRTHMIAGDVLADIIDFTNITTVTNNYVSFNNETYRIVKIENDRVVICKNSDFDSTATTRTNSNKYNSSLTYTDNSIIYSHSTDNKNLYLVKTLDIKSGKGTQTDPFIFENTRDYAGDKKAAAYITYKDGNTTLFTQPVYSNQTNYISYVKNDPDFIGWSTTNGAISADYELGDTVSFTSNTNLYAVTPYVTLKSGCYTIKGNILTNDASITEYDGNNCPKNVSIPSSIEGYTITEIGDSAFESLELTSVTIPNTVTMIGNEAFSGLYSATRNKLTNITIPDSVVTIGDYAFAGNKLISVTLGNSVQTIGDYAFANGATEDMEIYDNNFELLEWEDGNQITSITIPNSVITIGESAFQDNPITTISLSSSIESIGDYAFGGFALGDNNIGISNITIPSGVSGFGWECFKYPTVGSLIINTDADITNIFQDWEVDINSLIVNSGAFIGYGGFVANITNLYINSDGFSIEYNDTPPFNVENLYIDNMTTIPQSFLSGGVSCQHLYIGNSVEVINEIFYYYDGGGSYPEYNISEHNVQSISIGNSVTTIGYRAFMGYDSVSNLTIPNSVTTIGDEAFGCMSSLTNLTIPNSVTSVGSDVIGGSGVTNLTIGTGLTSSGTAAFLNSSLVNVISNSYSLSWWNGYSYPRYQNTFFSMYDYDINPSHINLTINNASSIPANSFSNMQLTQVTIANTVTSIGENAFLANSNLASIIIDNSCSNIKNMITDVNSWTSNMPAITTVYGSGNVICMSNNTWNV